ncbi:InlB B-repeat-containing protein [Paenibacillus sp. FSL H7-0331]|uniref:NHL domain-containing protein n=1 Tax=Paenibacillus sp. FSL H7-0331 TaxID=1920421 RepID=UPI00096BD17B|nr:InlB B-repeat-containing protein [Paenibacillus sp. FSL H7-0331]OMF12791.1 hypothetical protein BK127_22445 [Paenibacillus sp. FSL H7-0331]
MNRIYKRSIALLLIVVLFIGMMPGFDGTARAAAQKTIYTIDTIAGTGTGGYSGDNGPAAAALLKNPVGVAVYGSGNFYIADTENHRIRQIDASGQITLLAGNGVAGYSGDNGAATSASFRNPGGIATDGSGNVYIADSGNHRIRKVDASGKITTIAGTGTAGYGGDNATATSALLKDPSGIAVDGSGNVYIADYGNHRIRKINTSGKISTIAGVGTAGYSGDNGAATSAQLNGPVGVAVDSGGNVYIADMNNHRIRKVDASGKITTIAGTNTAGYSGDKGVATSAELNMPRGVALDSSGSVYITDRSNHSIRKIDPSGQIDTIAGNGTAGYSGDNGEATSAQLKYPGGLTVDSSGNVYVADRDNHRIRKLTPSIVSIYTVTFDSQGSGTVMPINNLRTGTAITAPTEPTRTGYIFGGWYKEATFTNAWDFAADKVTGDITLYAKWTVRTSVIMRKIDTFAGTEFGYSGDGGAAVSAKLRSPFGMALDSSGNFYIVDTGDHRVRKIDASGQISTIAGTGVSGYSGDGGAATSAQLNYPKGVAVDSSGNVYIADRDNHRIRKVDASGKISTIAGTGTGGYNKDNVAGTTAQLNQPHGVAADSSGNVYIADTLNNRIRKIDTSGKITTIAGSSQFGYSGDNGPATSAELRLPYGVALDSSGNVYIADLGNHSIRKVNKSGQISTIAGTGGLTGGYSGDKGLATLAKLKAPIGVAADASGNVYIADSGNNRIRMIDASGKIDTIAGTGDKALSGDNGPASSAKLSDPYGVVVDDSGNVYIADSGNYRIRKMTPPVETFAVTFDSQGGGTVEPYDFAIAGATITAPTAPRARFEDIFDGWCKDAACTNEWNFATDTVNGFIVLYAKWRPSEYKIGGVIAGTGDNGFSGDNGAAASAQLNYPGKAAIDGSGNIYIADTNNHRIRKVDPSGTITTIAGTGAAGYSGDNGAAVSAQLDSPGGIAVDSSGNVYIADTENNRIRKVDPSGRIDSIAGNGTPGYGGDNGGATSAQLSLPVGIAVYGSGNVYIADSYNHSIRKVDASGQISTIAGSGYPGYSGDNGPATSARLTFPRGVAVDGSGNVYIADSDNNRIRKVDASGKITTIAGTGTSGYNWNGKKMDAKSADLKGPSDVAVDSSGNVYIADKYNHQIRIVNTAGQIDHVAGAGTGYMGDYSVGNNGSAALSFFNKPGGLVLDSSGNLYIADTNNNRIRKVTPPDTYTLTFDSQGGGDVAPISRIIVGDKVTAPTAPTRQGYTLSGWYKEAAYKTEWNFTSDKSSRDLTLYAKWTPNTYTVTFDSQGGGGVASIQAKTGETITAPTTPTRPGYTFGGWYKEADSINAWNFAADTISGIGDITLYAKWTPAPVANSVLHVAAPTFSEVRVGYAQPEAGALTIVNSGTGDAVITAVYSSDTSKFTVGGSGSTVTAGGSITSWMLQPAPGLGIGTHTSVITVTYGTYGTYSTYGTATANVSLVVIQAGGSGNNGSNGGSKKNGAAPTPTTGSKPNEYTITINGKEEKIGTIDTVKVGNRTVSTITIDQAWLEQKLQIEEAGVVITIPITVDSDVIVGKLTGDMLKKLEDESAALEFITPSASYKFKAGDLPVKEAAAQLGAGADLGELTVQVEIAKADAAAASLVADSGREAGFTVMVAPVEFTVTVSYNGKNVVIHRFNSYVERAIAIPDGVSPSQITTGVVVNSDGSSYPVPTRMMVKEGRNYAAINSMTNSLYTAVRHSLKFSDAVNHWSGEAVNDMGSRMVINGVTEETFQPDRDITRAEFAAIMVRALGLAPGSSKTDFTDVAQSEWYAGYIGTAQEYGLIDGYSSTNFAPLAKITREQAMTIIARGMKLTGLTPAMTSEQTLALFANYADGNVAAEYARESIAACLKTAIVQGRTASELAPKSNVTRGEVAIMVKKLLQKSGLID